MHYLMSKDIVVLEIETQKIYNSKYLPMGLQGLNIDNNIIKNWIIDRALPITRKNADKIYQAMTLPRENSEIALMFLTHSLSINDNYWIADSNEIGKIKYNDISIFNNSFNKAMYLLALKGEKKDTFTITDKNISPEYTGQGNYPKCFVRESDGIYIYKNSSNKKMRNEIISGIIASNLGLKTAIYKMSQIDNISCTKSKIISDEKVNWETAASLIEHFNYTKEDGCKSPQDYVIRHMRLDISNMAIFDAIVLNDDRHMKNWSFEFNANTNELLGLAPSFDYNGTFEALPGTQSLLIFDEEKRIGLLKAARIAYRDIGTTLNFNNLLNLLDSYDLGINRQAMKNRILYITGQKSNQRDCYENSMIY